jgi:hypothetical protein
MNSQDMKLMSNLLPPMLNFNSRILQFSLHKSFVCIVLLLLIVTNEVSECTNAALSEGGLRSQ